MALAFAMLTQQGGHRQQHWQLRLLLAQEIGFSSPGAQASDRVGNDLGIQVLVILDVQPSCRLVDQLLSAVTGHVGQGGVDIHDQTLRIGDQNRLGSGLKNS